MIGDDSLTPYVGPPPGADETLAPGSRIGEYVVKARLAEGGHGAVYEAEHRVLGRRAAVKVMHRHLADSGEMVARFVREARIVNQIRHPGIVDIYDLGTLPDGQPYCVMEFLPGRSLAALLAARGRLEPRVAVAILEQVCAALSAAHAAGIVHRDMKASNVMVDDADPPRAKLLDFGIAKVNLPGTEGLTRAGERLGTQSYMSPEQLQCRPVDARTDVYGVGVLLYQLLTGRLPFTGADAAEVERLHLEAPPPSMALQAPVPPALDAVAARCLAKRPDDRYPSADALAAALRAAVGVAAPEAERRASAIYLAFAGGAEDDDSLARQAEALEAAETVLRERGFSTPLVTATAVLALRLLPSEAEAAATAGADALQVARLLAEVARASAGLVADQLVVWVHAGTAQVEGGEIVGGEVCQPEEWAAPAAPGVHATTAGASGSA
jgi:eukaryotic-like serine/threonine-protein kinase